MPKGESYEAKTYIHFNFLYGGCKQKVKNTVGLEIELENLNIETAQFETLQSVFLTLLILNDKLFSLSYLLNLCSLCILQL